MPSVKRRDLLTRIGRAAKEAGVSWARVRQGGNHEVWALDEVPIVVPRHREINELTARGILTLLEPQLGKDWWRS
jgi:mRNA interferase HicA